MKALSVKELVSKNYTFHEIRELLGIDTRTLVMEYQKIGIPLERNMNGLNDRQGEEELLSDLFTATTLKYSADLLTQNVSEKTKLAYVLSALKLVYSKEQSPVHIEVNAPTNTPDPTNTPIDTTTPTPIPTNTSTPIDE